MTCDSLLRQTIKFPFPPMQTWKAAGKKARLYFRHAIWHVNTWHQMAIASKHKSELQEVSDYSLACSLQNSDSFLRTSACMLCKYPGHPVTISFVELPISHRQHLLLGKYWLLTLYVPHSLESVLFFLSTFNMDMLFHVRIPGSTERVFACTTVYERTKLKHAYP